MAKKSQQLHAVGSKDDPAEETPTKVTPLKATPADAADIDALWIDQGLDDALTTTSVHKLPLGKPKDYFRTHPSPLYRRKVEVYKHKTEGKFDESYYVIDPKMHGRIDGARPHVLVTCMYRNGALRLWPIPYPGDDESDNDAWSSARTVAKVGLDFWVKPKWVGGAYQSKKANAGYAPDPDWSKVPPYEELVRLALGSHGRINDTKHSIYLEVEGPGDDGDGPVDDLAGDDLE